MPFQESGGRRIHFREGPRRVKERCLIFLHGAGGSSNIWLRQLHDFEDDFYVLAPDLPGHGDSEGEGEGSIEGYVSCLIPFFDALSLQKVILVGHSMGGAIAMMLALSRPDRVSEMVLAGSGAQLKVPEEVFLALKRDFKEVVRVICRYAYSSSFPTYLLSLGEAEMGKLRPDVLLADFRACDAFDIRSQLARINVPTLVLCGSQDRFTPPSLSLELKELLPHARLEIIEDVGHMAMIEGTRLFNTRLARFLKRPILT